MKIVEVIWVDAETLGDSTWQDIEEIKQRAKDNPPVMRTVGFVLHESDTHISVTDSLGENECGHMTKIPIGMVTECKVLTSD